jgi:two-component system cell cycle response regulator
VAMPGLAQCAHGNGPMSVSARDQPGESILLVDDDEDTLELLRAVLEREGYQVAEALGGLDAISQVERCRFDLVLSDVSMALGDGFTLVTALRSAGLHDCPVVLMSAEHDTKRRVLGLDLGADDFMAKPVQAEELLARVRAHLRRARRHAELKRDTLHDSLTGVLNRLGFMERFASQAALLSRRPGALSLLMIDVDGFKAVNDQYGHVVGDAVLKHVSEALVRHVRASDSVGRWGGDEFAILAPETDAATALTLCERVRALCPIQMAIGRERDGELGIGLSVGAATTYAKEPFDALLSRADAVMYDDKRKRKSGTSRVWSKSLRMA